MKTKQFENPSWRGQLYVSPSSKVVEFQPEGVLCGSGTFSTPDWVNDDDPLNFN